MFDEKLVLKTRNKKNPYNLVHDYWNPFTTRETIEYFKSLNLTNEELIELNEYINEDKDHSFYDNVFPYFEEDGTPLNFIESLREHSYLYYQYKQLLESSSFVSTYKNDEWICKITNFVEFAGYISFTVTGKGSSITAYAGSADIFWICFPDLDIGTSLSNPDDIFWNTEKLSDLFQSIPDAITVANAIKILKNFI